MTREPSGSDERRRPRRAQRPAVPGSDERPSATGLNGTASEDRPESWGDRTSDASATENEARLKREKPPHW
ncbi:hypothetical protein [Leucobacter sp. GX24907]